MDIHTHIYTYKQPNMGMYGNTMIPPTFPLEGSLARQLAMLSQLQRAVMLKMVHAKSGLGTNV